MASSTYVLPSTAIAGTIFLTQGFDVNKDIVVSFDYACYGPGLLGDEGFSVFFTNSVSGVVGGGPGPGLCYSPVASVSSTTSTSLTSFSGINSGIFGVGFDLTGNFGTSAYSVNGLATPVPNSISIRDGYRNNYNLLYNSGNLLSGGFAYPYSLYQQASGTNNLTYNRLRIRVTDIGSRVVIDIKRPSDKYFINFINQPIPTVVWPYATDCCLGFATGQTATTLKIKNFNVNGFFVPTSEISWTYYNGLTSIFTLSPSPALLYIGDTLSAVNSDRSTPLINITQGNAGLISGDSYISIVPLSTYTGSYA
jgi:hypothetical protein